MNFPNCDSLLPAVAFALMLSATSLAGTAAATTTRPFVADRSTPQAAMRTLVGAIEREDEAAIAAGIFVPNDPDQTFARAYARVLTTARRYWHATWSRWGRREAIEAYLRRGLRLPDSYLGYPHAEWDIKGDRAVVEYRPGTESTGAPSPLRNVNGQWLYDPMPRANAQEIDAAAARMNTTTAKYNQLAADIKTGKFASIHEAIDVLHPRRKRPSEPPEFSEEQLDPRTIHGAMLSLGMAYQEGDFRAAARFYHVHGPPAAAAQLAEAHARRVTAVHDFINTISSQIGGTESLVVEFDLTDPRDDLFGHLITEWTVDGDRATGTNDDGPAETVMHRVDGVWKIDLTPPAGLPKIEQLTAKLRRQTEVVSAVTADVREKRLFTIDEVRAALRRGGLLPATLPAVEADVE